APQITGPNHENWGGGALHKTLPISSHSEPHLQTSYQTPPPMGENLPSALDLMCLPCVWYGGSAIRASKPPSREDSGSLQSEFGRVGSYLRCCISGDSFFGFSHLFG